LAQPGAEGDGLVAQDRFLRRVLIYRTAMDDDLDQMDREQLIALVKRMRSAIRDHRDSTGHELCWHHPKLWGVLPERTDPQPTVPEWPQFMRGCIRYRQSLDEQLPDAPRATGEYGDK
jgi:hypothetical protein